MNDMLDVVHALFEEDSLVDEETEKARTRLRTSIYTKMYGHERYEWAARSSENGFSTADVIEPTTRATHSAPRAQRRGPREDLPKPEERRHYEYIPPTEFDPTAANPFDGVLDAPLG